jgi:hypothetical protein
MHHAQIPDGTVPDFLPLVQTFATLIEDSRVDKFVNRICLNKQLKIFKKPPSRYELGKATQDNHKRYLAEYGNSKIFYLYEILIFLSQLI